MIVEDAATLGVYRLTGGRAGKAGGGGTTFHFSEPINLPNVHTPEDVIEAIENIVRTHGVSSGRG